MTVNDFVSVAAVLISVGSLYVAWKKVRPEVTQMSAATAEKFQKIADDAADQILELRMQLNTLENTVITLKRELVASNERSTRFENWARRLAAQVISLGAVPVDIDPTKPIKGMDVADFDGG